MKERKFCGLDWDGMNKVLDTICDIEDRIEMTEEETDAFDIAVQCVAQVLNRMVDGHEILWDE